jgi:ubiquinone/menaquinone biosynthesis C-methylase UbiE
MCSASFSFFVAKKNQQFRSAIGKREEVSFKESPASIAGKAIDRSNHSFCVRAVTKVAASDSRASEIDILDAGCGEGFVVQQLHAYAPERTIVGLAVSQRALEIAGTNNPDIRFLRGSVYALPFENPSIRTVLLSEVLEHLEDPASALREAMRVASQSVIVSVPHEPWFRLGNLLTFRHVSRSETPQGTFSTGPIVRFKR